MNYTFVNLNEWSRGSLFKFYIDKMRIVMSLTADVNVTKLRAYSKKNNLKFYPLMLRVVSKIINSHDEFKYSWDDAGNLIKWDLYPLLTLIFMPMTKILSKWLRSIRMTFSNFAAELTKADNVTKTSKLF